jgi:hypothetical protein
MIYPRPEYPCGHHIALLLATAPASYIDDMIGYCDRTIRDPETDPELCKVVVALALDCMAARYDRDGEELAAILSEEP